MPAPHQVDPEHIYVIFYPSNIWVEKVGHQTVSLPIMNEACFRVIYLYTYAILYGMLYVDILSLIHKSPAGTWKC